MSSVHLVNRSHSAQSYMGTKIDPPNATVKNHFTSSNILVKYNTNKQKY